MKIAITNGHSTHSTITREFVEFKFCSKFLPYFLGGGGKCNKNTKIKISAPRLIHGVSRRVEGQSAARKSWLEFTRPCHHFHFFRRCLSPFFDLHARKTHGNTNIDEGRREREENETILFLLPLSWIDFSSFSSKNKGLDERGRSLARGLKIGLMRFRRSKYPNNLSVKREIVAASETHRCINFTGLSKPPSYL